MRFKVCIGSRVPYGHCRTVLQNGQDKTAKASLKKSSIMEHSPDLLKIPSLWEAALETKRRCFSKVILESNVTPNITRLSDSFCTVPPIVNRGDWGCIVRTLRLSWSWCFSHSISFPKGHTPIYGEKFWGHEKNSRLSNYGLGLPSFRCHYSQKQWMNYLPYTYNPSSTPGRIKKIRHHRAYASRINNKFTLI